MGHDLLLIFYAVLSRSLTFTEYVCLEDGILDLDVIFIILLMMLKLKWLFVFVLAMDSIDYGRIDL